MLNESSSQLGSNFGLVSTAPLHWEAFKWSISGALNSLRSTYHQFLISYLMAFN